MWGKTVGGNMKKKKNLILVSLLILSLCISFLVFFGLFNDKKSSIDNIAFIFTIFTEFLIFINLVILLNKKTDTFLVSGTCSTMFLYIVCSIILNGLLKGLFTSSRSLIVVNIILILVYLFINFVILLFKKGGQK